MMIYICQIPKKERKMSLNCPNFGIQYLCKILIRVYFYNMINIFIIKQKILKISLI